MSSLARRCRRGEAAACRQLARRRRAEEEARLFLVSPPPDDDGGETEPEPDLRLKYSPPDYSGYTVINVPASGPGTNGRYQPTLDNDTDYLVVLPGDQKRVGNLTLSGGRNIVIIGGEMERATEGDGFADQDRRCLYLLNNTGDVFVEGVHFHINGSGNPFDAVYIHHGSSRTTTLTFQNCLFDGIIGTSAGFHGDGIQFQGTALFNGIIRFHRCTFRTAYQGYYNTCDGLDSVAYFDECNWVCTGSDGVPVWFGDNTADDWARKYVVLGEGNYLDPDGTMLSEVRPNDDCVVVAERAAYSDGAVTWPNSEFITGTVVEGTPPGGDFVTSDIAGYGYESPGYVE